MTAQVVWHGTQQESFSLVNAIARNCTCELGLMGVRLATCAPHRMLTEDQRALNGLLFARRMAERLIREEWSTARRIQRLDPEIRKLYESFTDGPLSRR